MQRKPMRDPGRPGQGSGMQEQRQAIQKLAQSGEAQRLMSMLRQNGQVQQAAQAAAQGSPEQLLGMVKELMNTQEGAAVVERLRRQAEESGLS